MRFGGGNRAFFDTFQKELISVLLTHKNALILLNALKVRKRLNVFNPHTYYTDTKGNLHEIKTLIHLLTFMYKQDIPQLSPIP